MQEPGNSPETPQQQQAPFVPPSYSTPIPAPTGQMPPNAWGVAAPAANDSGTGATAVLPAELQGFNWGAFFLTWIWSIGQQFWLGLLVLPAGWVLGGVVRLLGIPGLAFIVNLGFMIGFGVKGNEWAWQYRKWDSIEQFRATQRVWAIWGVVLFTLFILFIIGLIVALGAVLLPMIMSGRLPGSMPGGAIPPAP